MDDSLEEKIREIYGRGRTILLFNEQDLQRAFNRRGDNRFFEEVVRMDKRKIAEESRVSETIKEVVGRRLRVESQEELAELVLKKLKKEDKRYSLSPIRVKRIALKIPEIEVKAKTKRTLKLPKIDKCPVCEGSIGPVKIKNLLNREIVIGYKCTACGYESDLEAFMPMKYIFILKQRYK
jgi:hypothetical protein